MVEKNLKAAFHTLGCKLNFSETSAIGKVLYERGVTRAARGDSPDIIIVNTCSVTETADKKGRQLIRRLAARYPEATMVVTGCYAQLKPEEVAALEGVDIVLGSNEKLKAAEYIDKWLDSRSKQVDVTPFREIEGFIPSCERGDRTRYFLKVQDGCDYFCTYCTIPYARGRSRSGKTAELVELARDAARQGGREIVITGVNIGDFGRDTGESFFDLLRHLDEVEGIERYRISSIEPNLLTQEIIEWTAREARAFMPHFHIPLQSGSDKVLRLMNRRYDTALFRSRIKLIKELIPDAFIGVDIIAGARGETPEEWEKSLAFADSLPVSRYHIFPYSERPGTKALQLDTVVSQQEKHRRVALLQEVSDHKMRDFQTSFIGTRRPVLWEAGNGTDLMSGHTDNYIRVEAPFREDLINKVEVATLLGIIPHDPESMEGSLRAEPINDILL